MNRSSRETPLRHWLLAAVLLLENALLATLLCEGILRGGLNASLLWIFANPLYALLETVQIFLLSLLVLLLTGRPSLAMGVSGLLPGIIALVSVFKLQLRDETLVFMDFFQIREGLSAGSQFSLRPDRQTLLLLALLIFPALLSFGLRLCAKPLRRILCGLLSLGLLILTGFVSLDRYITVVFQEKQWMEFNGVTGGFLCSIPRKPSPPKGYSQEAVREALSGSASASIPPKSLPDIWFIMCESLYDPLRLPDISVDTDPLPNLRALQKEGWGGGLSVSQYGGGTAQTEYEVLTGYRARDLSGTAYVSPVALQADMATLPTQLRALGYSTTAIHPGEPGFYQRASAYPKLGFDASLFRPDFDEPIPHFGGHPADSWLFEQLAARHEASERNQEGPVFSYIITYQNHAPYSSRDIPDLLSASAGGRESAAASGFVSGIRETDRAVGELMRRLRASSRPVVVVLFGDHAPSFSSVGSSLGTRLEDIHNAYTTPLLIWSNFPMEFPLAEGAEIPTYRLAAYVLSSLGLPCDAYFASLADDAHPSLFMIENELLDGGALRSDPDAWEMEDRRLWLLHYDRVFGQRYSQNP